MCSQHSGGYSFPQEGEAAFYSSEWEKKKIETINLAKFFLARSYELGECPDGFRLRKKSQQLFYCSTYLTENSNGRLMGSLCRQRLCPMCEWRRSMKRMHRIFKLVEDPDFKEYRAIFVTLTVKNLASCGLSAAITHLSESFNRLMKAFAPAGGYMRSIEVTQGSGYYVREGGQVASVNCHPHIHAIVLVRQSYFKKRYWSHARWVREWAIAAMLDYEPSVHVKACGGSRGADPSRDLREVTKSLAYSVKPIYDDEKIGGYFIERCALALKGRRLITCGGKFKEMWARTDDSSNEEGGHSKDRVLDPSLVNWRYNYSTGRYHFFKPPKADPDFVKSKTDEMKAANSNHDGDFPDSYFSSVGA